ncbi:NAD-dependent epimerase/dehydratase family protein [Methylobacillus arboreus]|uniref:NAD-dependent epimerase/dehydratase family protein n=1 Tax=Methylobacillus arboreus TaxID=755170 RepID=UPI001E547E48|nr:NAD-dependent epimerase/dehydratase family protein [Methylobacillus arboreus]MCB5189966.1 NAD-dependent epimerase/dehydratase family protein [Methylobacillus arboreus]
MTKLLVTGVGGFIGGAVYRSFLGQGCEVVGVSSRPSGNILQTPLLNESSDWRCVLDGVDVVIHAAARAHVFKQVELGLSEDLYQVNTHAVINIARQAANMGVRRFLFVSTVGVHGYYTEQGVHFSESSPIVPHNDYARTKAEAEKQLMELASQTGIEVVIIRPPLVYGAGAKGNFAQLMKWVRAGLPLPLGAIDNLRSFVALDNLISLIIKCIDHPAASNEVFLVSDGEDLSTSDLLRRLAKAAGVSPRLIPIPASLLSIALIMLGRKMDAHRLLGSLQVDISKTRELLGWAPPVSVDEGLRRCFSVKG